MCWEMRIRVCIRNFLPYLCSHINRHCFDVVDSFAVPSAVLVLFVCEIFFFCYFMMHIARELEEQRERVNSAIRNIGCRVIVIFIWFIIAGEAHPIR